ncbi:hypothetical protein BC834DRAFT_821780 [Gloeopeniophorella convolvens]|nr:hypothetical protein BC834DRAFT_821780 [Gloeopeniophorella convolvens]
MSTSTDNSRNNASNLKDFEHTSPIPILGSPHRRRASVSSSSDGSASSPPALQTPVSLYPSNISPSSPTSSPLLSYFMSTSPKTNATFPYRRPPGFGAPPVFEDDEAQAEVEAPSSLHQRRATTSWAGNGRLASQQAVPTAPPVIEEQHARGAGVLRRLSLSGSFNRSFLQNLNRPNSPPRPATPPPSAVSPTTPGLMDRQGPPDVRGRARRSATLSVPSANARRRAPSPMGERILKGHFDGFN